MFDIYNFFFHFYTKKEEKNYQTYYFYEKQNCHMKFNKNYLLLTI